MNPMILFILSSLFIKSLSSKIEPAKPYAHITVMGLVYCDICSNNSFSRHSYFLPGAEVRLDCKLKASLPRTTEQVSFSVNRTTNRYGLYKLEIPSVDGMKCAEASMASFCEASLMRSSSKACNVPGHKWTSDEIAFKAKRANLCIYSLNALNFRPSKKDVTLCGK
uniref:Pollen Ole e 1 allergen and extensin family protein n=1 Tax=Rhizophora mucronata TaxID=61149 RepID=A0A2P2Q5Z0_RHIMU